MDSSYRFHGIDTYGMGSCSWVRAAYSGGQAQCVYCGSVRGLLGPCDTPALRRRSSTGVSLRIRWCGCSAHIPSTTAVCGRCVYKPVAHTPQPRHQAPRPATALLTPRLDIPPDHVSSLATSHDGSCDDQGTCGGCRRRSCRSSF